MRKLRRTSQFKKDVKRMGKRGKKFKEFKEVIGDLLAGRKLEDKYKDHYLVGQYKGIIQTSFLLLDKKQKNDTVSRFLFYIYASSATIYSRQLSTGEAR